MEFKHLFFLVFYILMISVSVFSQDAMSHITAMEGVLDLREWDPRHCYGTYQLKILLPPENLSYALDVSNSNFVRVPGL